MLGKNYFSTFWQNKALIIHLRARSLNLTKIDLVKTVSAEETDFSSTCARSSVSTIIPARLVSTLEHRSNILSWNTNKKIYLKAKTDFLTVPNEILIFYLFNCQKAEKKTLETDEKEEV